MKADIHPDYHEITVVMTDGTEYKTKSTWGKEGDVLKLDVDPKTHPAWQGGAHKVIEKGQLSKFEKRFGTFLSGEGQEDAPQQTEPEAQEKTPQEEVAEAAKNEAQEEEQAEASAEPETLEEDTKEE